jgi:hypothetical protein
MTDRCPRFYYGLLVHRIRPTIKALSGLPRESFDDPTMLDIATSSDERKIVNHLRLASLGHPLLDDARKQIAQSKLSTHRSASSAAGRSIYEARQRDGAGWRGAFTRIDDCWWLVHVDRHDEFNSRVGESLKQGRSDQWMPNDLDWEVLDAENADAALEEWRIAVIHGFVEAIATAAANSGKPVVSQVPAKLDLPGERTTDKSIADLAVTVIHNTDLDVGTAEAHLEASFLQVELNVYPTANASDATDLQRELIGRCVPYLGVPQEELDTIYGRNGALKVSVLVTHSKLLQMSQDPDWAASFTAGRMAPGKLHYASKTTITTGYVTGSTVEAICGFKFVPTRDEYTAAGLPICRECEEGSPSDSIIVRWKDSL